MNGAWQGMRRIDVLAALLVCLLIAATGVYMPLVLNYPSYFKDFLLQSVACILFLLWAARGVTVGTQNTFQGTRKVYCVPTFLPEILLVCYIALNFLAVGWSGLPTARKLSAM